MTGFLQGAFQSAGEIPPWLEVSQGASQTSAPELGKSWVIPGCAVLPVCSEVRAWEPEGPGQSEQHNKSWPGWFALVVHRHFSKAPAFSFHWWGGAFLLLRSFVAEKRMKKITSRGGCDPHLHSHPPSLCSVPHEITPGNIYTKPNCWGR